MNFEDYLKCFFEYEEESGLKDDMKVDYDLLIVEFENIVEMEDISFEYCF